MSEPLALSRLPYVLASMIPVIAKDRDKRDAQSWHRPHRLKQQGVLALALTGYSAAESGFFPRLGSMTTKLVLLAGEVLVGQPIEHTGERTLSTPTSCLQCGNMSEAEMPFPTHTPTPHHLW